MRLLKKHVVFCKSQICTSSISNLTLMRKERERKLNAFVEHAHLLDDKIVHVIELYWQITLNTKRPDVYTF